MSRRFGRGWRAGCLLLGLVLCVAGCGSSRAGGDGVVASVAGVPITKASLDHWMQVESVLSYKVIPTEPAPQGVLPDPPTYTACIAWLASTKGPLEARSMTAAERKAGCRKRLQTLKSKTLGFLISYQWYLGEAKERGIQIPESTVQRNLKRFVNSYLPGKAFQRYLTSAHMREPDALFVQRLTAYGEAISKLLMGSHNQHETTQAITLFTTKWIKRTTCQPNYTVPGCHQYHGPEPPP